MRRQATLAHTIIMSFNYLIPVTGHPPHSNLTIWPARTLDALHASNELPRRRKKADVLPKVSSTSLTSTSPETKAINNSRSQKLPGLLGPYEPTPCQPPEGIIRTFMYNNVYCLPPPGMEMIRVSLLITTSCRIISMILYERCRRRSSKLQARGQQEAKG